MVESETSKRPKDSAFQQQKLPAWQPILTAGSVLPTFFIIGIAFIPAGIGLLYFSDEVKEFQYDYTNCENVDTSLGLEGMKCADILSNSSYDSYVCKCKIPFNLSDGFDGRVYMYYGLTNFYQNHRRYVKSRDDNQLLGKSDLEPSADCAPFAVNNSVPIAPCGAIANSLFTDELAIYSKVVNSFVPLLKTGIAWPSDKSIKFENPKCGGVKCDNLSLAFQNTSKPIAWRKPVYELDPTDDSNNGYENEDLIVWMRTSALPSFRKLYRRVNHSATGFKKGLLKGEYELHVNYTYQVASFQGTKRMILSTTSLLGGKNPFLGIAYIVVGSVCLVLGVVFLFIHIKCGKSTRDRTNVTPRTEF